MERDRENEIRIGLISDIHWRNTSVRELPSIEVLRPKVDLFIDSMNHGFRPDMTIQMGDAACSISDPVSPEGHVNETTYLYRLESVREHLEETGGSEGRGLDSPVHHVMGNHEYKMPDWDRSAIHRTLGFTSLGDTWYSIDISGITFIVLNTGYTAGEMFNHSIPPAEIDWLDGVLHRSTDPTFIFTHIPVTGGTGQAYDSSSGESALRDIIEEDPDVVALFYGHCHHVDEWDRLLKEDVNGTNVSYYHIPAPHELMDDVDVTPWGELTVHLNGTYVLNASYDSDTLPTRWWGSFEVDAGSDDNVDDGGVPGFQTSSVVLAVCALWLVRRFGTPSNGGHE